MIFFFRFEARIDFNGIFSNGEFGDAYSDSTSVDYSHSPRFDKKRKRVDLEIVRLVVVTRLYEKYVLLHVFVFFISTRPMWVVILL